MSAIIGQVLPFLSQEHQQQVATAVERAKQVGRETEVLTGHCQYFRSLWQISTLLSEPQEVVGQQEQEEDRDLTSRG